MDILQRKINDETDSALRAQRFSDLGVISLIDPELAKFQPFGLTIEQQYVHSQEVLEHRMKRLEPLGSYLEKINSIKFGNRFNPLDGSFDYPSDKQLTEKTSDEMRLAEGNLDTFWDRVDKGCKLKVGSSIDEKLNRILQLSPRELVRTPKWAELAAVKGAPRNPVPAALDSSNKQASIKLSVKSLKVFRSLFWRHDSSNSPAEISWRDFVAAMVEAGFVPEELYGSLCQFTPARFAHFGESVQLHAPWPLGLSGKIERKTALRVGCILGRRLGWEGAVFCRVEKGEVTAVVEGLRLFAGVLEGEKEEGEK